MLPDVKSSFDYGEANVIMNKSDSCGSLTLSAIRNLFQVLRISVIQCHSLMIYELSLQHLRLLVLPRVTHYDELSGTADSIRRLTYVYEYVKQTESSTRVEWLICNDNSLDDHSLETNESRPQVETITDQVGLQPTIETIGRAITKSNIHANVMVHPPKVFTARPGLG